MPKLLQRFKECVGNIWSSGADLICITTNPVINKRGEVVMGRGTARQAKDCFPGIASRFAEQVMLYGNHVQIIWSDPLIACFPVKHDWRDAADPKLIERSAAELYAMVSAKPAMRHACLPIDVKVALPRPGCSNGRLLWEDVKPLLVPILDERFTVYSLEA